MGPKAEAVLSLTPSSILSFPDGRLIKCFLPRGGEERGKERGERRREREGEGEREGEREGKRERERRGAINGYKTM